MMSSKSRVHRLRVLENLAKYANGCEAAAPSAPGDPQARMPLIVEVKTGTVAKPRARRARAGGRKDQPELGEL